MPGNFPEKLEVLSVSNCGLGADISLFLVSKLPSTTRQLYARNNQFAGSLPSFSNVYNLENVDISNNQIGGEISQIYFNLTFLREFSADYNGLTGTIPQSLFRSPVIQKFSMAGNKLYGNVPELPRSLTELSLSNNALDGGIPQLPPTLRLLDLSENQMTGTLDVANVSVCTELVSLDLSGNSLQGNLPLMTSYNIEVCTFYVIRIFYEKPTKFQFVDLSSNQFSGQIPPSYRNFVNFNTLNLSTNSLTGVIPEFQSWNLRTLDLSGNFLAGNMIKLSYVQNLDYLDVSNNNLNGSLPNAITNMTNLNYINMVSFSKF